MRPEAQKAHTRHGARYGTGTKAHVAQIGEGRDDQVLIAEARHCR